MDPFDIRSGAALGLVVAVAAPLGDLAESMFKRSLGVKDMGAILPGPRRDHGSGGCLPLRHPAGVGALRSSWGT